MLKKIHQSLVIWLIRKVQKYGPHKVLVHGKTYLISEDVFNPKYYYTSRFMAKNIRVNSDDIVLDMGTGSGIQAITAGQHASKVVAVDINPEAVRFSRKNVSSNSLENIISVLEGDLFGPLDNSQRFNVIIFTPPYMHGERATVFDHALFDPDKGLLRRFFTGAKDFIEANGNIQMLYSSIAHPEEALKISRKIGWKDSLISEEKTFSESFLIYKLTLD